MSSVPSNDEPISSGVVELREDEPLRVRPSGDRMPAGLRLILSCFSALALAVTVALATQIYYGDYELVPHGAVAADARACSRAGTDALKAGGGAPDAAIATALCLAVVAPHHTSLDSGGVMMVFDYRHDRAEGPEVLDFSGVERATMENSVPPSVPRLIEGLAHVHRKYGRLPWEQLVRPAAHLARNGFAASPILVSAIQATGVDDLFGELQVGEIVKLSPLAHYLDKIANASTGDIVTANNDASWRASFESSSASRGELEGGSGVLGGSGYWVFAPPAPPAIALLASLRAVLQTYNYTVMLREPELVYRTATSLVQVMQGGGGAGRAGDAGDGAASNVAVIDKDDVYVSMVTGLSRIFGTRKLSTDGFLLDEVTPRRGLTPIIMTERYTCGKRFVLGSNDISVATQVMVNLITSNGNLTSVERPRFNILGMSEIGLESDHIPTFSQQSLHFLESVGKLHNATPPYASCNLVRQAADELASHADSRGGGIASRY